MNNNDLSLILKSNVPIIVLETYDEHMALQWLSGYVGQTGGTGWRWTHRSGFGPLAYGVELQNAATQELVTQVLLEQAIQKTQPLSVVMSERIEALRE